jgi:hypothetical protein
MLSSAFIPPETLLGCTELGCDAPFSSARHLTQPPSPLLPFLLLLLLR